DDDEFAAACAATGNVFLPFDDNSSDSTPPDLERAVRARLSYPIGAPTTAEAVRIRPPVAPLLRAMRGGGHVATKADTDGKFRSSILLMEQGATYPHVALDAVARMVWRVPSAHMQLRDGYLVAGSHRFGPLEVRPLRRSLAGGGAESRVLRRGTGWMLPLNFLGGHSVMELLTVPYLDALDGHADERLRGRVVIVGETATGTPDLRPGPFDSQETTLGVETNATFVANLLEDNFLNHPPLLWAVLATLGAGLISGLAVAALRPLVALGLAGSAAFAYMLLAAMSFANDNRILEMTAPLLAGSLCFTALAAYRLVFVDRAAREYESALRETQVMLGQFVNERLAEDLCSNPEARRDMQIGTRREVSVLFSDIRGFTSWSENQAPEEVKSRLDEYFPAMCEIAYEDYDGYIDKYIGDALMVVWNAHKDQPDHAERAVRAALSMHRSLAMLNDGWRRQKQQEFRIGVGVATGSVVFGTFGSPKHKLMPTALGDTVNLASRLETATKEHGSNIIISEATYQAVKDQFEIKPLGALPIRGKAEAQQIYEVLGLKETVEEKNAAA
ncbi:MAG TPA: adenylate/guanylate cyclase domain-containing protein, partial [Abditibacteriaceae bacterium]|nr:adenylate/guanylate cyclase domain-containing protein [Abditibacteriaceae bacterium]